MFQCVGFAELFLEGEDDSASEQGSEGGKGIQCQLIYALFIHINIYWHKLNEIAN